MKPNWALNFLIVILLMPLSDVARAQSEFPRFQTTGNLNATLATHVRDPSVMASEKIEASVAEKVKFAPDWSGVFGFRAWEEPAYSWNPKRYPSTLADEDSRELRVRDFYVEHKTDDYSLRVGNQPVVWGEAFGYFYSDIVNPKDFRFGGFGDLTEVRIPVPMANFKYTTGDFSLQTIWIPKPFFSLLPLPGSDFAFPYQNVVGIGNVSVQRQESASLSADHQELGMRASYLIGTFDLSAFYFTYYDRFPFYTIDSSSSLPQTLVLDEQHSRVNSFGLTGTTALGDYVFRFEGLTTLNRIMPSISQGALSNVAADDYVYVIGMDVPSWNEFNLGFQWSQDVLIFQSPTADSQSLIFRNKIQNLASIRIQRPTFRQQSLEVLYTYETSDGGQRIQTNYLVPISGQIETTIGVDYLSGSSSSDFGRIKQGSRGFVLFKFYLKG